MRCVLDPGDTIVDCPPTFTMYAFDAAVNAASVVTIPRLDGFRIDVPGQDKESAPDCMLHKGPTCILNTLSVIWPQIAIKVVLGTKVGH